MPFQCYDPRGARLATRAWLSRLGLRAAVTGMGLAISLCAAPVVSALLPASPAFAQGAPITSLPSFADLAEKVRPAVVSINTKNDAGQEQGQEFFEAPESPQGPGPKDWRDFFDHFRKRFPNGPKEPQVVRAQGSGFLISADGYVVTNHHVVDKATEITVTMDNDQKHEAEIIGSDQRTDVALLKIKGDKKFVSYLDFSRDKPRVGDWVLAVGNPFGLGGTVTAGIVSARNRDIQNGTPYDFLQIDAAVNRGNSGGPAINLKGEVVGVNTAIFSPSGGNVGIAFSIPADLVQNVVDQLKTNKKVSRGWLGVGIQAVTEDIADSVGLKEAHGALIAKIFPDGPSAKSELKPGDVVLEVNGELIKDSRELARKIAELKPQADAKLTVYRDGSQKTIVVKLGDFPAQDKLANLEAPDKPQGAPEVTELGITVAPASEAPGSGDEGVVIVSVDPSSDAAEKGLKPRDVILDAEQKPVTSPAELAKIVREAREKSKKAILLRVRTGAQARYVGLSLTAKEKGKKDASKGDGDKDKDGKEKKQN